jgi:FkbM family methyltransferase
MSKFEKLLKILCSIKFIKSTIKGIAPTTEHIQLLKSINNLITIIDIGANKGQFSLSARHVFKDSNIFSFEPLEKPASEFKKLFNSDNKVTLFQSAIGPQKENVEMHVSKRKDSSSILPIGNRQSSIFPGTEESHIEEIKVGPLHQFLSKEEFKKRVFVKIDVQGYELDVLKGCEELIHLFDFIYVECSFIELYEGQALAHEVIKYLNSRSFELKGIYNTFYHKNGIAVQSDFLFKRVDENI